MSGRKSGKRPINKGKDGVLVRRLAGAMPRVSAQGRNRSAEWLSSIAGTAAGKTLKSLVSAQPRLGALLSGIAGTAPYLWDLIRADPARLLRLLTTNPDTELAALLKATQRSAAAARGTATVMRVLRRMKADAALLIALADLGGVWPLARVTASLTDVADSALRLGVRYLPRPPKASSSA
jgi:[glutamine synthetase] adenylyltransferase / [glutamine synthetase]-adenylyl-L-tyrosine phosphorylase